MIQCRRCHAELSDWELDEADALGVAPCWCDGAPQGVPPTLANLAYAELCHAQLAQPVKTHDVARFITPHYHGNPRNTTSVALSRGKRFCWGGQAMYGLARHGLIPGARSLAEAAYAVLLAASRELHVEEVDFVLEQLNYRFNPDSLLHHLRGYTRNRWDLRFHTDHRNRVWVSSGRDARREYNQLIKVCPSEVRFDTWIADTLAPRIEWSLTVRTRRLAEVTESVVDLGGDRVEFH